MTTLNVGKMTPEQKADEAARVETRAKEQGAKIVTDKATGATYAVEKTLGGLTIQRRLG